MRSLPRLVQHQGRDEGAPLREADEPVIGPLPVQEGPQPCVRGLDRAGRRAAVEGVVGRLEEHVDPRRGRGVERRVDKVEGVFLRVEFGPEGS